MPLVKPLTKLGVSRAVILPKSWLEYHEDKMGHVIDTVLMEVNDCLKITPAPRARPLRVCRVCGLEANTEEDLTLFTNKYGMLYGRDNSCKKCTRELARAKNGTSKLIESFLLSFEGLIHCYFCKKPITELEGKDSDSLIIHSLDGNHKNWDPANKVPSHNACHGRHHNISESDAV